MQPDPAQFVVEFIELCRRHGVSRCTGEVLQKIDADRFRHIQLYRVDEILEQNLPIDLAAIREAIK